MNRPRPKKWVDLQAEVDALLADERNERSTPAPKVTDGEFAQVVGGVFTMAEIRAMGTLLADNPTGPVR